MIFSVSSPCPSYYSSFGSCLYWLPCPPLSENTPNQLSAALQRSPSTTGRKTATSLSTEIALGSLVLYTRSIYLLAPSAVYGSNLCVWSQHVLQRIPYPSHVTHLSICTEIHLQFSSENDVNRIFQISSTESIQRIDSALDHRLLFCSNRKPYPKPTQLLPYMCTGTKHEHKHEFSFVGWILFCWLNSVLLATNTAVVISSFYIATTT